ncbi:hypothetical protein L873DRAFT_1800135, partial [Choiromyces venosus 120613-1]
MFSLKNLIFQVLIPTIVFAALTTCSPLDRLSNEVSRRSDAAAGNTTPGFENMKILDM